MKALIVEFCGDRYEIDAGSEFSFGRTGDLAVDDNPYLHRKLGRLSAHENLWWLTNEGTSIALKITDRLSGSQITLAPSTSVPLVFGSFCIRFHAGPTWYEIEVALQPETAPAVLKDGTGDPAMSTVDAAELPMTAEQLLLLVALAEPHFRRGQTAELPSNQQIAARLGWTITKFNRKLDNVCAKLARRGVAGLQGSGARLATARRHALVEYVTSSGMITPDQIALLPGTWGEVPIAGPRNPLVPSSLNDHRR